jgi:hypothetical protein
MSDRVAAQYEYFLLRLRGGCVSTAPFRVLADATDWIQLQHLCLSYGYSLDPARTPQRPETRRYTA